MRPCEKDHKLDVDKCRLCHLYTYDRAYRDYWDTPKTPAPPCKHLGEETGEAVGCATCGDKIVNGVREFRVRIKLRACAVHQKCTTHKPLEGTQCCNGCPDYCAEA